MPKKINWDNVLNKAWLYTKVFFATSIICVIAYTFGTFNPNKISTKKANADLEKYYLNKIKDLDSKMNKMDIIMKEDQGDGDFTNKYNYFRGPLLKKNAP